MKNETIVDRVVERLKAQPLGDLITEEDLHEIVRQAIPKVFFEPRKVIEGTGYHQRTVDAEPQIVETMRVLLKESAQKALASWLAENAETVADHWRKVIDASLLHYVKQLQSEKATAQVKAALLPMMNDVNQERQKLGLPPIYF